MSLVCGFVLSTVLGGFGWAADQTVTAGVQEMLKVAVSQPSISLTLGPPATAGAPIPAATDSSTYLRYTSVITASDDSRLIKAQVSDNKPAWLTLSLTASTPPGDDDDETRGWAGASAGVKDLRTSTQTILNDIKSCKTGTSGTSGSNLQYALSINQMADARAITTPLTLTVTFTTVTY